MAVAERRDCKDFVSVYSCSTWELIKVKRRGEGGRRIAGEREGESNLMFFLSRFFSYLFLFFLSLSAIQSADFRPRRPLLVSRRPCHQCLGYPSRGIPLPLLSSPLLSSPLLSSPLLSPSSSLLSHLPSSTKCSCIPPTAVFSLASRRTSTH